MLNAAEDLLVVKGLKKYFPLHGGLFLRRVGQVYAVDDVSLRLPAGQTLGLVGESGCGKTTVGRCLLRLYQPTAGAIRFGGQDLATVGRQELRTLRRRMQAVFQDPFDSLNPRHTVDYILQEPLRIHRIGDRAARREKARQLLDRVGLPANAINRFPHEFSGGQRQRLGIARALALDPQMIVCDEPVSALDVSIQSQIMNLLLDLQQQAGLAYFFIAHDLAVVKHLADRIAVMYLGKIVEQTEADTLYRSPRHPYTRALISAIPEPNPGAKQKKQVLTGEVPSPAEPPPGCRFHTRCPYVKDQCRQEEPILAPVGAVQPTHLAACHRLAEGI